MKIVFILFCIILILLLVVIFMFKLCNRLKKQVKEISASLEKQKENARILAEHVKKLSEIDREKTKVDNEIEKAESDSAVLAIVNSIIASNNRLCNDKKK